MALVRPQTIDPAKWRKLSRKQRIAAGGKPQKPSGLPAGGLVDYSALAKQLAAGAYQPALAGLQGQEDILRQQAQADITGLTSARQQLADYYRSIAPAQAQAGQAAAGIQTSFAQGLADALAQQGGGQPTGAQTLQFLGGQLPGQELGRFGQTAEDMAQILGAAALAGTRYDVAGRQGQLREDIGKLGIQRQELSGQQAQSTQKAYFDLLNLKQEYDTLSLARQQLGLKQKQETFDQFIARQRLSFDKGKEKFDQGIAEANRDLQEERVDLEGERVNLQRERDRLSARGGTTTPARYQEIYTDATGMAELIANKLKQGKPVEELTQEEEDALFLKPGIPKKIKDAILAGTYKPEPKPYQFWEARRLLLADLRRLYPQLTKRDRIKIAHEYLTRADFRRIG